MLSQPALFAGLRRGNTKGMALLAKQGVAAVARALGPNLTFVGEVADGDVFGIAWPLHILLAHLERCAHGMDAAHKAGVRTKRP